jgi:hypothetical protein
MNWLGWFFFALFWVLAAVVIVQELNFLEMRRVSDGWRDLYFDLKDRVVK